MARGSKKPKAASESGGKVRGRDRNSAGQHDPQFHTGRKGFTIDKVSKQKLDARNARVDRWEGEDDVPEDEEDAFHRQRDAILLSDGRGVGRAARGRGGDDDGERPLSASYVSLKLMLA